MLISTVGVALSASTSLARTKSIRQPTKAFFPPTPTPPLPHPILLLINQTEPEREREGESHIHGPHLTRTQRRLPLLTVPTYLPTLPYPALPPSLPTYIPPTRHHTISCLITCLLPYFTFPTSPTNTFTTTTNYTQGHARRDGKERDTDTIKGIKYKIKRC